MRSLPRAVIYRRHACPGWLSLQAHSCPAHLQAACPDRAAGRRPPARCRTCGKTGSRVAVHVGMQETRPLRHTASQPSGISARGKVSGEGPRWCMLCHTLHEAFRHMHTHAYPLTAACPGVNPTARCPAAWHSVVGDVQEQAVDGLQSSTQAMATAARNILSTSPPSRHRCHPVQPQCLSASLGSKGLVPCRPPCPAQSRCPPAPAFRAAGPPAGSSFRSQLTPPR